uniref:Uncharacterized protein n=1 Tax=Physcomitrium patens TaxID=3218 RepID=A0A2K1IST7_PHYPA|nr:hypothetical protein PHYPA_026467 [Physcomitrium patens]
MEVQVTKPSERPKFYQFIYLLIDSYFIENVEPSLPLQDTHFDQFQEYTAPVVQPLLREEGHRVKGSIPLNDGAGKHDSDAKNFLRITDASRFQQTSIVAERRILDFGAVITLGYSLWELTPCSTLQKNEIANMTRFSTHPSHTMALPYANVVRTDPATVAPANKRVVTMSNDTRFDLASSMRPQSDGLTYNYAGFLIKQTKRHIQMAVEVVAAEERFLADHLVIANFISSTLTPPTFATWLSDLNVEIGGGRVVSSDNAGQGFLCLKAPSKAAAWKILVLTPYRSHGFMCFSTVDTKIRPLHSLSWITLKRPPWQHACVPSEIASNLGIVLARNESKSIIPGPHFCVALDTSNGWKTEIEIEDRIMHNLTILVDYAHLPI